ncbi:DNA endonuclease SmrA [Corallincola spongiicola]|uniref:DNA endonuclease SmrA n=1 Tax=Corallincola spongiicola TaxID=2520508 RepID=A0ABY1WKQ3_9GAMM|nr:DNA endonuclease SmrA [Corallincola spongiicola]TAA40353.1 DNA endonuclease SmrA [Corallincola spongiicola]
MSDDEYLLFDAEMADVKKLAGTETVAHHSKRAGLDQEKQAKREAAQANLSQPDDPLSTEIRDLIGPDDELSFVRPGVQHGVFKKLRQGRYQIEARLDLHQHSVEQARLAVKGFLDDCRRMEVRSAIIVHGIGRHSKPPALLKSAVNQWLQALAEVQAFHTCQRHHGGLGAVYVMLKKGATKKLETKERIQHRRG